MWDNVSLLPTLFASGFCLASAEQARWHYKLWKECWTEKYRVCSDLMGYAGIRICMWEGERGCRDCPCNNCHIVNGRLHPYSQSTGMIRIPSTSITETNFLQRNFIHGCGCAYICACMHTHASTCTHTNKPSFLCQLAAEVPQSQGCPFLLLMKFLSISPGMTPLGHAGHIFSLS